MKRQNTRKGFTITELIIVIAVVAILAAVLIPTFVSLIKKANMSADEQAVRQMNTILAAEEAVDGKPATVAEAKEILIANGISDFTPMETVNTFYWVGADNVVLLWTADEVAEGEPETGKVTYPKEMVKKYGDVTEPSADWSRLDAVVMTLVEPEEGQSIVDALIDAVEAAQLEDHTVLTLPKNSTLEMDAYDFMYLYKASRVAAGDSYIGKDITIDLNGGKLVGDASSYAAYAFYVYPQGTLTLANGKLDIKTYKGGGYESFCIKAGASLVLRDIDLTADSYAVFFPASNASEVILESCNIDCGNSYFGLMTNGMTSDNIKVVIKDTTFVSEYSHAVILNVHSNLFVENSTISAPVSAIALRSGHAEIVNSTLKTTDPEPGIYSWVNFDHFNTSYYYWSQGNMMPGAGIVLGDHSPDLTSYEGAVDCQLTNVKFESADVSKVPTVLLASKAGKNVTLTYDGASNVGSYVLYDYPHALGHATVTVNGAVQTFTNKLGYNIPAEVGGTYAVGSEQDVSILDKTYNIPAVDHTASFKEQIADSWGVTLTDTEWATAKLTFSSTKGNNQLKTITYTKDDGTEAGIGEGYGGNRITLKVGSLALNGEAYSNLSYATMDFIEDAKVGNYLADFKTYCNNMGVTLTDAQWATAKVLIGVTTNHIVDVKY